MGLHFSAARPLPLLAALCCLCTSLIAQQPDQAFVVQHIDAAMRARFDHVAGYTVIEHYALFHDGDAAHPMAEMTVRAQYRRDTGKTYTILSQSGSAIAQKMVFTKLLENEKSINNPATRESSWFTSANYNMTLKPGAQQINGRDCYVVSLSPKHKAPNMIDGTIWVDTRDFSTVQIDGVSSRSPSLFTGVTHMTRQYANQGGFAQATHAHAETNAFLLGKIVLTIDYTGYQVQVSGKP